MVIQSYQGPGPSEIQQRRNDGRLLDSGQYIFVGWMLSFNGFIQIVYSMIATTSGSLNPLYPALVIALSNASPYFKKLSVTASTRLTQLFTSFSNPLFLLSDEGHPRLLFFM